MIGRRSLALIVLGVALALAGLASTYVKLSRRCAPNRCGP